MEINNQANTPTEEKKPSFKEGLKKSFLFIWELVKIALIALVIVLPIRYFLFQPFIVSGDSMVPNFHSGDYLIVDEISYRFSDPQRGDVIVFNYPKQPSERFIKRVIGLPGETIIVTNGQVEVLKDGKTTILEEAYLPTDLKTIGDVNVTMGEDEYFVLGDNRDRSFDSRSWGTVPRKNIIGKAFFRVLPVAALSQIANPAY